MTLLYRNHLKIKISFIEIVLKRNCRAVSENSIDNYNFIAKVLFYIHNKIIQFILKKILTRT